MFFLTSFDHLKNTFRKLSHRKHFFEFIAALLTVPLLLTVIVTNILGLQQKKEEKQPAVSPIIVEIKSPETKTPTSFSTPRPIISSTMLSGAISSSPSITLAQCNQAPQPYTIVFPKENESVIGIKPLCIVLEPVGTGYCSTKLSYRVNDGGWSEYQSSGTSICFSDLKEGQVIFQMRTNNDVSSQEQVYTRRFTYSSGEITPSPTSTP